MKIFEEFSKEELKLINIQFLGLRQGPWGFSRGARTERLYKCREQPELIHVRDHYEYTMDDGNREILDYKRIIEWIDHEGNVGLTQDISPELNVKNLEALNENIRRGRMHYLKGAAKELKAGAEQLTGHIPEDMRQEMIRASKHMGILFKYYADEIESYKEDGTMDFENAVLNETDSAILEILNLTTQPPGLDPRFPNGFTVKTSIIYQLNGTVP
jgi:hypothetical protein